MRKYIILIHPRASRLTARRWLPPQITCLRPNIGSPKGRYRLPQTPNIGEIWVAYVSIWDPYVGL